MIVEKSAIHRIPALYGRHDGGYVGFIFICSVCGHFGHTVFVVMSPLQGSPFVGCFKGYNHIAPLGLNFLAESADFRESSSCCLNSSVTSVRSVF